MKRKFTFFGICVLVCTLMISLGSCQKDYSEDIDDLQEQINDIKGDVAALNQAIAQGKIITSVSNVTGGYEITFSDNSSITIEHGEDGADGADGADGETGADGFTPIIGVDEEGYWTVITTEGGDPVRIQDVDGNDVKAELNDEFGVTTNGMLTIGGVETAVQIPVIVYNEETETLQITIKDENDNFVTYNIPVAENVFSTKDLVSVVSPIGETTAILGYGNVPSTLTAVHASLGQEGLDFAGVALGDQLKTGGEVPVILNPSGIDPDDYTFEIIEQDGSLFGLQPSSVTEGYDGAFAQFAAGSSSGLYTMHFTPALADMTPLVGDNDQLAVRVVKDGREVISGYQYTLRVAPYIFTDYSPKDAMATEYYVPIGSSLDVLDLCNRDNATPSVRTLVAADFYKSAIENDPSSVNSDVQDFVTLTGTTVATAQPTIETVSNLNDKKLSYFLKTFDWVGIYEKNSIDIVYYAELDTDVADIDLGSHTLDLVETEKSAMLTPMFSALQAEGKTELWRSQATNVQIEIYKGSTLLTPTAAGIDYQFKDAADAPVAGPNAVLTALADVQAIRKVEFDIDATVALPGDYKLILTFDDRRSYAQGVEFEVEMPLTIVNPTIAALATATEKKANVFDGQKLSVYGTAPSAPVQGLAANWYYNIYEAYKNLSTAAAPVAPAISVNNWAFYFDGTTPSAMLAGLNDGRFDFGSILTSNVTTARPYTEYPVELYYFYFGNMNNYELLETITVEARSEVKDGTSEVLVPAAPAPSILQVTNGDLTTVRNFAPYFMAKDYLGVDLDVFGTRDARIASVTVTVPSDQDHLIDVVPNGNDWDITATNNVAVLPTEYVDIPVTLTITDILDVETEYTINVRVVKP